MKLIVGLGNPGRKYEQTRHNVGFMVVSKVAGLIGAGPVKEKFSGEVAEGMAGKSGLGLKVVLLCPHTFMNGSGKSVRKACDFYKLLPEDLLVVCDDLNLGTGRIRIRATGSAGGQKGLADTIRHLGTEAFPRLRIGIDRPPPHWDVPDYVLGKFAEEEKDKVEASIDAAARAALDWAIDGIDVAMNRHNINPKAKQAKPQKQKDTTKQQNTDSINKNSPKSEQRD
ncbi:MAG: aminoacyl-tRNA hydrolase [Rubripirellula sp.]